MLSDVSSEHQKVTIYPSKERATKFMLECWTKDDVVLVSVPCGAFQLDIEAARNLDRAIVAGTSTDGGAVLSVGKALTDAGTKNVILIVENNDNFGDVVSNEGLKVKLVEKISSDMLESTPDEKCGVFVFPSLSELAAKVGGDAIVTVQ
jgi:hypothetical protein